MNCSSKFFVATHIMVAIASRQIVSKRPWLVKSDQLAKSVNTNPVVIRRILGMLRKAELIDSVSGPEGGSWIPGDPMRITLRDIYDAVESAEFVHKPYSTPNPCCPVGGNVLDELAKVTEAVDKAMRDKLNEYTLAKLCEDIIMSSDIPQMLEAGMSIEQIEEHFQKVIDEAAVNM
ncbi:MAG: Rrf2 family transcriptional regulator [Calditrichota bacterium]